VQLHTVAIVAPRTVYGVPNVLQFCGSQECCAECGARFCGIRLPQQITPVQSIEVRYPSKKQGAQLCGCQHGVVLNDGCPEWNPSLHGTISPIVPLYDMAKQHHHMLLAVLENRFVHYNLMQLPIFIQEHWSSFVNMLLGRLNWASTLKTMHNATQSNTTITTHCTTSTEPYVRLSSPSCVPHVQPLLFI